MAVGVVKVWFEAGSLDVSTPSRFLIIETEMPDFATFCEMVEADRLIGGAVLWTRKSDVRGEMVVTGRRPIAFRGSTVLRCELPIWNYVNEGAA